jgi:hypothetical protein
VRQLGTGRIGVFAAIFSRKAYIAIAAASALVFYYVFYYLVVSDNYGVFLVLMPIYLIYLLVATSGILFSISVFTVAYSAASRRLGVEGGIMGVLLPSMGGIVAGCACALPLLTSILLFLGINAFEALGIVTAIGIYQLWIVLAMIAINTGMIYYYLGRLPASRKKRQRRAAGL